MISAERRENQVVAAMFGKRKRASVVNSVAVVGVRNGLLLGKQRLCNAAASQDTTYSSTVMHRSLNAACSAAPGGQRTQTSIYYCM